MKAIMVMFDSLNRRYLSPYGCDWVKTPSFDRLAKRSVTFDVAWIGSMPCMPARRELHTGRHNFLHRSWGPIEPFDDSMPRILDENGIYTHLITDHNHYFEDGGATYHNRYTSYEFVRGQEGDPWKAHVDPPDDIPPLSRIKNKDQPDRMWDHEYINRRYMPTTEDQPISKVFNLGLEFIETNHEADNWFLQIESFDPHEPFFTHEDVKNLYPHEYYGPFFDWPSYGPVVEPIEQVHHARYEYAALVSLCDRKLGEVMDAMDKYDLWDDTMLIVTTDHGYILGEHDWWAKNVMPWYNETAHIPMFLWDPRTKVVNERRHSIVQNIDVPVTLLNYFNIPVGESMQGGDLKQVAESDTPIRDAALFGVFGGHVNMIDGRYIYMRAPVHPDNKPLYAYTFMPTHIRSLFSVEEMETVTLAPPFSFTKGLQVMRIRGRPWTDPHPFGTLLFDLVEDPKQEHPIDDPILEEKMIRKMIALMQANDAPADQYERLGIQSYLET